MKAIQVGSIGLGSISRGVHLPGIEKSPDLSLYAICDLDPQRLQEVGERYAVPESRRFTDYRQLIACPGVEAVDISTPNDCHFPIAMEAVRAGKPYCLEKPVTMNADQARELAQATGRSLRIADLYDTVNCPLCRIMRKEGRKRGIRRLRVLYSAEEPVRVPTREGAARSERSNLGTASFMPPIMGQMIAGAVLRELAGLEA